MQLEYVKNLSPQSADMYIYDVIGDYGISAQNFVRELSWLKNEAKIPLVNVRINSGGGSVIAGLGIYAAIANMEGVNTYNDGIAASIAGVILMGGAKRFGAKHALTMIHDVSIEPEVMDRMAPEEKVKAKAAMDAMRGAIISLLTSNGKKGEDEISEMLKKETWMDSAEALEMGLIDQIYDPTPTKRMAKNELAAVLNTIIKPKNNMKNINLILNLDENAAEDVAVKSIEQLQADLDAEKQAKEAAEQNANDLQAKLDAMEAEKATATMEAVTTEATTEVENAIKEGKFSAEKKAELIATAVKDLAGFKNMVASITSTPPASINNQLNKAENKGKTKTDWTIRDWEKNDPLGLAKMQNETPEVYKQLYNDYYKPGC